MSSLEESEEVVGMVWINILMEGWKKRCLFSILLRRVMPASVLDLLNAV